MTYKRRERAQPVEPRMLAFVAAIAVAIIILTFRTWVDFDVAHLRGTDADAMTSIGDGYFVIALAIAGIACAGALYLRPKAWAWLLPPIGIAAIGIAAIAAYQAGTPWHASGFDADGAFVVGGHATAAVYEVFALAAAMGLAAALLASVHYQRQRRESAESEAQRAMEGSPHDQPNPGAAGRLGPR